MQQLQPWQSRLAANVPAKVWDTNLPALCIYGAYLWLLHPTAAADAPWMQYSASICMTPVAMSFNILHLRTVSNQQLAGLCVHTHWLLVALGEPYI
jgi:hypothetical protein